MDPVVALSPVVRFQNPLHEAAAGGDVEEVHRLLMTRLGKRDIDAFDRGTGFTPLHLAVKGLAYECVEALLEAGANVNLAANNAVKETPLGLAVKLHKDAHEMVKFLLARGAEDSLSIANAHGLTPFLLAAELGDVELCKILALKREEVPVGGGGLGRHSGSMTSVRPACFRAMTAAGETALHIAAARHHTDLIEWLQTHGWDSTVRNQDGKLASDLVPSGSQALELINSSAKRKLHSSRSMKRDGDALLDAAAKNADTLRQLVEHNGALLVRYRDARGQTALHSAARSGNFQTAEYLLSLRLAFGEEGLLSPNAPNGEGWTPLHLAARLGALRLVDSLIAAAANPHITVTLESIGCELIRSAAKEAAAKKGLPVEPEVSPGMVVNAIQIAELCGHHEVAEHMAAAVKPPPESKEKDICGKPKLRYTASAAGGAGRPGLSPAAPKNAYRPLDQAVALAETRVATPPVSPSDTPSSKVVVVDAKFTEVINFLTSINLLEYADAFRTYGFDKLEHILHDLTEDTCRKMHIDKPLHVDKLMSAVVRLRGVHGLSNTPPVTARTPIPALERNTSMLSSVSFQSSQNTSSASSMLNFDADGPTNPFSATLPAAPAPIRSAAAGFDPMGEAADGPLGSLAFDMSSLLLDASPAGQLLQNLEQHRDVARPTSFPSTEPSNYAPVLVQNEVQPTAKDGPIVDITATAVMPSPSVLFASSTPTVVAHARSTSSISASGWTFADFRELGFMSCCAIPYASFPADLQGFVVNPAEMRFAPKDQLGEGSYGVVYKSAFRGADVAVKVIKLKAYESAASLLPQASTREERDRLLQDEMLKSIASEIRFIAQVARHDNIVQFRGVLLDPLAIVTEYMTRGNADALVVDRRSRTYCREKFTTQQLVRFARDAAAGFIHLHALNVVHRDVAARNLLISGEAPFLRCKVSDFGFSRLIKTDEGHVTNAEVGPVRWMAPETLQWRISTLQSDVFAFGVTMYELFTGIPPWQRVDLLDVSNNVLRGVRMRFPEGLDSELQAIIERCWQQDPAARPTMQEVFVTLDDWCTRHDQRESLPPVIVDEPLRYTRWLQDQIRGAGGSSETGTPPFHGRHLTMFSSDGSMAGKQLGSNPFATGSQPSDGMAGWGSPASANPTPNSLYSQEGGSEVRTTLESAAIRRDSDGVAQAFHARRATDSAGSLPMRHTSTSSIPNTPPMAIARPMKLAFGTTTPPPTGRVGDGSAAYPHQRNVSAFSPDPSSEASPPGMLSPPAASPLSPLAVSAGIAGAHLAPFVRVEQAEFVSNYGRVPSLPLAQPLPAAPMAAVGALAPTHQQNTSGDDALLDIDSSCYSDW